MLAELITTDLAACLSVAAQQPRGCACACNVAQCGCLLVRGVSTPSCRAVTSCMVRADVSIHCSVGLLVITLRCDILCTHCRAYCETMHIMRRPYCGKGHF
jgi:hypothetical protein